MTREETKAILNILRTNYSNFYKNTTKEEAEKIIDLWSTMLADEASYLVTEAVKVLIRSLKYPPTIADVVEKIALLTQPQQLTEMEAWQEVRSAISYYNAQSCFDNLSPIIQKIVGSPNQLRLWATMEADEVDSVIASNFMRSYKSRVSQEKEMALLPENTRQLIKGLSERMALTDGGD